MGPKKKLSGAQRRQLNKKLDAESDKMKNQFQTWLSKNTPSTGSAADNDSDNNILNPSDNSNIDDEADNVESRSGEGELSASNIQHQHDNAIDHNLEQTTEKFSHLISHQKIDFNNPETWIPITDDIRCLLVSHGPEQTENKQRHLPPTLSAQSGTCEHACELIVL